MGFEICGILVLWEKGGEEGRNREKKVGQEPWSIRSGTEGAGRAQYEVSETFGFNAF